MANASRLSAVGIGKKLENERLRIMNRGSRETTLRGSLVHEKTISRERTV